MTQTASQLSLFDDDGAAIVAAIQVAHAEVMAQQAQARASKRRATVVSIDTSEDHNVCLPDGMIDQGAWQDADRLKANLDALAALDAEADREGDALSDSVRNALLGYVGWGGLANVLDEVTPANRIKYAQTRDTLRTYIDGADWPAITGSVLTAYYTSEALIDAIWSGVRKLGFTGGRVLEPAAGIGHFIGRRPNDLACEFTAVECEPKAAAIASRLYPSATVHADRYESVRLPNNRFDLAISNVPFGDFGVTDSAYTGGRFASLRIHDYYFLKTLDKIRPGGLIAFVTTHGTLDKVDNRVRREIAKRADLCGAFRLPSSAFKDSANTQVAADVLFLQKRDQARMDDPGELAWVNVDDWADNGRSIQQNTYFDEHPEAVLGERVIGQGRFGPELLVRADSSHGYQAMADQLPQGVYVEAADAVEQQIEKQTVQLGGDGLSSIQVGAFTFEDNGALCVVGAEGVLEVVKVSKTAEKRIALMIPVRDAAYEVIATQVKQAPLVDLHAAQAKLHRAYDAMTKRYGPISKPANRRAMCNDPAIAVLLSLEHYDEKTQTATKTEIFTERTIGLPERVERAKTPHDALAVSLNEHGRVLPDRLCALLDQEWPEIREELRGSIYRNPRSDEWETASRYLSGNVVVKLAEAREAALSDGDYRENVDALQAIQPEPLGAGEIDVNLGAPWVPEWVYHQFAGHLLGMEAAPGNRNNRGVPAYRHVPYGAVSFTPALGLWEVDISEYHCDRSTFAQYGTPNFSPIELIKHALNQKLPVVWTYDTHGNKVKDFDASNEAQEKLASIKEAFAEWLWSEGQRTDHLCSIYNERFNNRVERIYDGSHLTFPGLSLSRTLRPHQANFAWRVVESGNTYAAHVVGSGKTGSMVAAAMESKRLGLARKPMVVVPNNLLYDFAAEALRFYPGANVLIARKEDISKHGRRQFLAKVSSRNWDLIVMTHESFGRVPLSDQYVEQFIRNEIAEYEDLINETRANNGDRISIKNLEMAKRRLEARLDKLANQEARDHAGLCFEALGVDMLLIDESHLFKNLEIRSRMGSIPGVTNAASQRALDLFMKTRWVMAQSPHEQRNIVFASGTPISNSMTELYTNLKYLAPNLCAEHDIAHFDSWAAAFGEVVAALERAPEGSGYRVHSRFSRFVNVPELVRLFRSFADVKMADDLDLPTPEADRHHHVAEPSDALIAYMKVLGERAALCRSGAVDKRDDNILKIANDGRHASLDMRLIDPAANDDPGSMLRQVAETIDHYYVRGGDNVQLVFCDLGTPKSHRFSIYTELRTLLIDAGLPAEEIAFAQDYKTDAQRQQLYAAARAGQLRVVLGSTAKMGMGMNAQDKISDIHHVDAPWRPADIDQRDGRGLRQGNEHDSVRIHTYVTRDSYAEFMWETLKRKAGFITQALTSPDKAQRRIADTVEPKYAEIMALASGDPRIREKVEIDDRVDRLKLRYRYHRNSQARIDRRLSEIAYHLDDAQRRLHGHQQDMNVLSGERVLELANGQRVQDADTAQKAVRAFGKDALRGHSTSLYLGTFGGFEWRIEHGLTSEYRKGYRLILDGAVPLYEVIGRSGERAWAVLNDLLDSLNQRGARIQARIDSLEQEHAGLITQQGRDFEDQDLLETLLERQKVLNRELMEAAEQATKAA
ncbi:N-6 DNA methylase [Endozoicomonas sp. G2_2]|uniref:N-6 DNA methylase n=1 Tax=Endozoicomonas sp. G2_2 TaxID=2821092 RepID=UPI001AD9A94D|nr:N-6 DNA methylase [Endozoicomonas sp. G2_2]MBO9471480.1 N-6 DNA methylase [Endozoicomonas sp. G2_2]